MTIYVLKQQCNTNGIVSYKNICVTSDSASAMYTMVELHNDYVKDRQQYPSFQVNYGMEIWMDEETMIDYGRHGHIPTVLLKDREITLEELTNDIQLFCKRVVKDIPGENGLVKGT